MSETETGSPEVCSAPLSLLSPGPGSSNGSSRDSVPSCCSSLGVVGSSFPSCSSLGVVSFVGLSSESVVSPSGSLEAVLPD